MFINATEFATFLILQQNPLLNVSELAERLNTTFYKADKAYKNLFEKNLVKGISSIIAPINLSLERYEIIFEIESFSNVLKIEKLLEAHNYTRYHSRYTQGSKRGIYVQFDIPLKCKNYLKELANMLKKKNLVDRFEFLERGTVAATTGIDLNYIDWESLGWKFDATKWFDTKLKQKVECKEEPPIVNKNSKINEIDLWILRTLSKNAMLSNKEILDDIELESKKLLGKKLEKDLSTISRRLKFVKDTYISESQLLINNKLFNLSTQIMFNVRLESEARDILCQKMKQNPLPFRSALTKTQTGFRWLLRCPSDYISEITNYIWKLDPAEMSLIYFMPESKLYWFYPLNYDVINSKWNDSREYFFNPIEKQLK